MKSEGCARIVTGISLAAAIAGKGAGGFPMSKSKVMRIWLAARAAIGLATAVAAISLVPNLVVSAVPTSAGVPVAGCWKNLTVSTSRPILLGPASATSKNGLFAAVTPKVASAPTPTVSSIMARMSYALTSGLF